MTLRSSLNRCADCQRVVEEPLKAGLCRICFRMDWRVAAVTPTPIADSGDCPRCEGKRKRVWGKGYCKPCIASYINEYNKKVRAERRRARTHRGVDIDAVHRNPRWMKPKLKKAA